MSIQFQKRLRQTTNAVIWGAMILGLAMAFIAPVHAQDDAEVIPLGIAPLSPRTAVLSVPISVIGNTNSQIPIPRLQEIQQLTVVFEDKTPDRRGLSITEDFLPLDASALASGIALFQESNAQPDRFSYFAGDASSDTPVDLSAVPTVQEDPVQPGKYFITFRPVPGSSSARIPLVRDAHPDFHIVVQTTLNLMQGDTFKVYIPANGITIRDRINPLPKNTLYDTPFPDPSFSGLNPDFGTDKLYVGDIINIVNFVKDTDSTYRIGANSDAKTVLGIDFAGRADQDYFVKEVNVNFIGVNLAAVGNLIAAAGIGGGGNGFVTVASAALTPKFFFNPFFYNYPEDPENPGMIWMEQRDVGLEEPISYPKTMPLNFNGFPLSAFFIGSDDVNSHVMSYLPYGPRPFGSDGLQPTHLANQDIFLKPLKNAAGGFFLYREVGGLKTQYDAGVDRILTLDESKLEIKPFPITADLVNSDPALNAALRRLLPGVVGGEAVRRVFPWMFQDSDLSMALVGIPGDALEAAPDWTVDAPRPTLGSLECYQDEACFMFDLLINISRPFLGLTEGQVRYLHALSGNEKSNLLDLFNFDMIQGFTVTMPLDRSNAAGDLRAPTSRTGVNSGPDIYLAVKTSNKLRNLDSILPFIRPKDIKVGNNLAGYTQGATSYSTYDSVSSLGYGRPNTDTTSPLIGRPRPLFQYDDLTTPGEGTKANNNNVIYDRVLSSPPKAVIGIDAIDFGQNHSQFLNSQGVSQLLWDRFFTESTVLGDLQVEFLPGSTATQLLTLFSALPLELGITQEGPFLAPAASISLWMEDDTPSGNGIDDDGDMLVDEEWYNLQDDDGDGLIDEDLGDYTPAGINGVFDANDRFLPTFYDNWGDVAAFSEASYVFTPNDRTKYEEYITAIEPANAPFDIADGQLLPLSVGEGSWFADLDFRVLNYTNYETNPGWIFPPSGSRPFNPGNAPIYNQGMYRNLDIRASLLDLWNSVRPDSRYSEDLCIEVVTTGEQLCMIQLTADSEDQIAPIPDPDGDVRRSFLLSMARALRFPNPLLGFCKVGMNPMVVGVGLDTAQNANDPQGGNQTDPQLWTQFGYFMQTTDNNTLTSYLQDMNQAIGDAVQSANEAIQTYLDDVATAEDDCSSDPECSEPQYPDPPDPIELQLTNPYSALGMSDFLQNPSYTTNYMYQIQIPDENFGPLAGDDFYIVLRTSPQARVGDSFRVRIRSGQQGATRNVTDPDTGEVTVVNAPEGGLSYHSYLKTDWVDTEPFRGISKNQITTGEIVVRSENVAPKVTFLAPKAGRNPATDDLTYQVSYIVQDPDNSPQVTLFVDSNNAGFDGEFLSGSLTRATSGVANTYTVNLLTVPGFDPTNSYYIYARVDDGINTPIFTYADGPITTAASSGNTGGGGGSSGGGGNQIVVTGALPNRFDIAKLSVDGRTFTLGDLPSMPDLENVNNLADMEPAPTFAGAIGVEVNGTILASGDVMSFNSKLQQNGTLSFPASEISFLSNGLSGAKLIKSPTAGQIAIEHVRDIEVDWNNGAIYVLDGDGDMLYLGANAKTNLRPPAMGIDVYRDMEISPDGKTLYFLTGNGILSKSDGSSSVVWSKMSEDVDKYPDMDIRFKNYALSYIIVTDSDGKISTINGGDSLKSAVLQKRTPAEEVSLGSVRQVKLFPDRDDMYLLVEGGGELHYMTTTPIASNQIPADPYVFPDSPGLNDDLIVDVETASVNLQSVVDSINDILAAYKTENTSKIMSYVHPNYKDKNGADAKGLKKSLETNFSFMQVDSHSVSRANQNSFVISNQGDVVKAQVLLDLSYYYPQLRYLATAANLDSTALTTTTLGTLFFSDRPAGVEQTFRVREVLDGRSWLIDFYSIKNFGRLYDQLAGNTDIEFQDISYLSRLSGNTLMGTYAPKNKTIDDPKYFKIPSSALQPFQPFSVMIVYREQFYTQQYTPPVLEIAWYNGSHLTAAGYNQVEFEFRKDVNGAYKMSSMSNRFLMGENDRSFDFSSGIDTNFLTEINDLEVLQPFGFSFKDRGMTVAVFRGDADLVLSGQSFYTTDPRAGIMMLPENTDIFSINPTEFVKNLSRSAVLLNPFDPNPPDATGQTASWEQGRSYFVITSDGKHYGFIQVPDIPINQDTLNIAVTLLDYRYEDSFVLPSGF
ncbi:MAG: hypothetical protein GC154_12650 [bacterium]|nr:hypothetical protein [bacterium]